MSDYSDILNKFNELDDYDAPALFDLEPVVDEFEWQQTYGAQDYSSGVIDTESENKLIAILDRKLSGVRTFEEYDALLDNFFNKESVEFWQVNFPNLVKHAKVSMVDFVRRDIDHPKGGMSAP